MTEAGKSDNWATLSPAEKKQELFRRQKDLLDMLAERLNAALQAENAYILLCSEASAARIGICTAPTPIWLIISTSSSVSIVPLVSRFTLAPLNLALRAMSCKRGISVGSPPESERLSIEARRRSLFSVRRASLKSGAFGVVGHSVPFQ